MKILGVKYLNFIVSFYDLIHFEIFEKRLTVAHQKSVARFDFYFESTTNEIIGEISLLRYCAAFSILTINIDMNLNV